MNKAGRANIVSASPVIRRSRSTSSLAWFCAVAGSLVLLLLRSRQLHGIVATRVAGTEAAKSLSDPALTELSINIGFSLGLIISGTLTIMYFSLASIAESTFFPRVALGRNRFRVGVLGAVAIMSLLSTQIISLMLSISSPKDRWQIILGVAVVGLGLPWIFRRRWADIRGKSLLFLFPASLSLAAISLIL